MPLPWPWGDKEFLFHGPANHGPACIAFHGSHPIYHSAGSISHSVKTWVSLQTTTYKSKSTKYFDILLLLTCEEVLHAPTVQVWAQNSTIWPINNLLIVCHSCITNWSQNTLSEFKLKNARNYRIWEKFTCNFERVFCDQFVMEDWQTITRLFGGKMVEFWAQIYTVYLCNWLFDL